MTAPRRIELYDTTLRDGTQGPGIALTLADKLTVTKLLDAVGFDFIEGGYPLSNPKDAEYFEQAARLDLQHAKVCAFGMTRRKGIGPQDDEGMKALVASQAPIITIVGKTWDLHVDEVLRVSRDENLDMIRDSVRFCSQAAHVDEVFYDAEHFFDGYKANPTYARQTLLAAIDGGATRLVLCDTNGGTLPTQITAVMADLLKHLPVDADAAPDSLPSLAIHPHNDSGLAVANALAAVDAGAVQVQGTINGIGERCGNVDLITVAANLALKYGHDCLLPDATAKLAELSREVFRLADLPINHAAPYVGQNAFTHKGGMHVHAVQRIAHSYEHVPPESVGNRRTILVSELAGASNIVATLGDEFDLSDKAVSRKLLETVQDREHAGYQYEFAHASLELLAHEQLGTPCTFWDLDHYRCIILRKASDDLTSTEAIVKLAVRDQTEHRVGEGDGPVNALDTALRKALRPHFPQIDDVQLTDYAVRVVNPKQGTAATVRVLIEFSVSPDQNAAPSTEHSKFRTIGVHENIIDASWQALSDAFRLHLLKTSPQDASIQAAR
ncbi:MAG: citramalate synthase [Planctomycetota bacterium]